MDNSWAIYNNSRGIQTLELNATTCLPSKHLRFDTVGAASELTRFQNYVDKQAPKGTHVIGFSVGNVYTTATYTYLRNKFSVFYDNTVTYSLAFIFFKREIMDWYFQAIPNAFGYGLTIIVTGRYLIGSLGIFEIVYYLILFNYVMCYLLFNYVMCYLLFNYVMCYLLFNYVMCYLLFNYVMCYLLFNYVMCYLLFNYVMCYLLFNYVMCYLLFNYVMCYLLFNYVMCFLLFNYVMCYKALMLFNFVRCYKALMKL